MATDRKQYTVKARVLLEGATGYRRAGHRFGPEPVTVTVLPEGETPKAPYELTPAQFKQLDEDINIHIRPGAAPPPSPAAVEQAETKRLEDEARDAERRNTRGR